jgi:hypothetical protein
MRFTGLRPLIALAAAGALGGCAMEKRNAEQAIAAADSTLQTVAVDAESYVPERYAAAGAKVTAAREDFTAGNYADALVKAQEATTEVEGLGAAITARKDELTAAWTVLSDTLPGMVQAIQQRVDELGRMRRLPAGVTAQTLEGARTALQEMNGTWTQATEAFGAGKLVDATSLGATVQTKAAEVMAALKMR